MKYLRSFCSVIFLFCLSAVFAQTPKHQFKVLLYAQADYWHSAVLPNAVQAMEYLSIKHHFEFTWTQTDRYLQKDKLFDFDVLIFLNSNTKSMNDAVKSNIQEFVRSGKGFVGIHAVIDGTWSWFDKLIGRKFLGHPPLQTGIVEVTNPMFPATLHLEKRYLWTDEWYDFDEPLTENQNLVLAVDNTTYINPNRKNNSNDKLQPLAWFQEYDGGRSFYIALGHLPAAYLDDDFRKLLYGAIYWSATGKGV